MSEADKATVSPSVRITFIPAPKFETTWTVFGFVQGKIVSPYIEFVEIQVTIVQDGVLMQVPSEIDCPAIIISRALQVSSDCCCVTTGFKERRVSYK